MIKNDTNAPPPPVNNIQAFPKWKELGDFSLSLCLSFFPNPSPKSGDVRLILRVARFGFALPLLLEVLDVLLFAPANDPSPTGLDGRSNGASSSWPSPPFARVFPLSRELTGTPANKSSSLRS